MEIDPNTLLQRLLAAFPASRAELQRLGIDITSNEPLHRACEKAGIRLVDVQTVLTNIDWTRLDEDSGK